GSFIFFGVFAMSVVASHYAEPQQRSEHAHSRRATSALAFQSPPDPPRAAGGPAPCGHSYPYLPLSYPIGWAYRWKLLVKTSLIIVNTADRRRAPRARKISVPIL